jgi:glycosyltransferase involved in cell wall biosynthesis
MNRRFRISIAMTSYNGERFIGEQLESFSRQLYLPDELVITDDGSTDGTIAIIERFARNAPFSVELHRNRENLGWAKNFEKAINLCSGDFIFLSDQDDVWLPEKILRVMRMFENRPNVQVIINDAIVADESLTSFGRTHRSNIDFVTRSSSNFYAGCCSAHRKSWHDLSLPIPSDLPHDYWINGLAMELGCAYPMTDALQYYRRHATTSTEWVLSDPRGISPRLGLSIVSSDGRPGWRLHIRLLTEALRRLHDHREIAHAKGWDRQIPHIEQRVATLERRIEVCSIPRSRRALKVFKFWSGGGYERAAGWKSAAADLIRR